VEVREVSSCGLSTCDVSVAHGNVPHCVSCYNSKIRFCKFDWELCDQNAMLGNLYVTDYIEAYQCIIIIIRHELGLDKPISASSISLFEGLPRLLLPFGPQFRIVFGSLLFILVTCRRHFHLHLSFSSTGFTFNSSRTSSFSMSLLIIKAAHYLNFKCRIG